MATVKGAIHRLSQQLVAATHSWKDLFIQSLSSRHTSLSWISQNCFHLWAFALAFSLPELLFPVVVMVSSFLSLWSINFIFQNLRFSRLSRKFEAKQQSMWVLDYFRFVLTLWVQFFRLPILIWGWFTRVLCSGRTWVQSFVPLALWGCQKLYSTYEEPHQDQHKEFWKPGLFL